MQNTWGNFFKTYCDYSSDAEFVWTLIETFSLANLQYFAGAHFRGDWSRNESSVNWLDFCLSRNAINYITNQRATHFRATCDFEKDAFNTDYQRGKIATVTFGSGVATSLNTSGCESLGLVVTTVQRKPGTHQAVTCT